MTGTNPAGADPFDETTSEGDMASEEDSSAVDSPKEQPVGADQAEENRENDPPS